MPEWPRADHAIFACTYELMQKIRGNGSGFHFSSGVQHGWVRYFRLEPWWRLGHFGAVGKRPGRLRLLRVSKPFFLQRHPHFGRNYRRVLENSRPVRPRLPHESRGRWRGWHAPIELYADWLAEIQPLVSSNFV